MTEELIEYGEQQPAIFADDSLLAMAEQAERRIEAVIKIKQVALKVTNAGDWVDQNGKPYLQVSGAEKIGNLFNVSWRIDEPLLEMEEDGHYTYTYRGVFSMAGRSIQVEGSRSSKDGFFKQYSWENNKKSEKSINDRDNKRDVKMAALTNLLGNGITRLLGIRNLSYADLEAYAGIKKNDLGKVEYKSEGKKEAPQPQRKSQTGQKPAGGGTTGGIQTVQKRALEGMLKTLGIETPEQQVETIGPIINRKFKSLDELTKDEAQAAITGLGKMNSEDPKECTRDPNTCPLSGWAEGKAYCGPDSEICKYQGE